MTTITSTASTVRAGLNDQHGDKSYYDRKKGRQRLGDGLADHLAQRVCIVGVKTHDRAGCILIKIPDRKGLHVLKHIVTDPF